MYFLLVTLLLKEPASSEQQWNDYIRSAEEYNLYLLKPYPLGILVFLLRLESSLITAQFQKHLVAVNNYLL